MSKSLTRRSVLSTIRNYISLPDQVKVLQDLMLFQQNKHNQLNHPNPLNKFGMKCFSQADEDGITLEILRRINRMDEGIYAEFGVGDGTENNTLILAALGWKGFWVGREKLAFDVDRTKNNRFVHIREWVTLENVTFVTKKGLAEISSAELDVISLDLDGNDIYIVEELLSNNIRPRLFIVEYNAKFPPPVRFQIRYNPRHTWKSDDYFGASLASFHKLFEKFGYRLLCCNSHTGVNAFFIDASYSECFSDVPTDINQIYVEPRYHRYNRYGHKQSVRTIENIVNGA